MRLILPVAMMLACATAVQGQQQEPVAAPDAPTAVAGPRAPAPAPPVVTAPEMPVAPAPAATVRADERAAETAATQTVPRNFWWLVGGIVLAGLLLALLL